MAFLHFVLLTASLVVQPQDTAAERRADCHEWHECRQLALDALARGEYERFHDLAWRTIQTGPPRDPALMYLLARAQSLSGRVHDALVMLGRLAEMGVASDAITNDEFRNVRTLRDWPELESKIRRLTEAPTATAPSPASPSARPAATAPPASPRPAAPATISPPAAKPAVETPARPAEPAEPPPATEPAPPPSSPAAPSEPAGGKSPRRLEDALRLPDLAFKPQGLAYDGVSGRFVVADRTARKLVVLDERSRHAVDLVRASSAGFSDIGAFEIDARRGDLWVASTDPPGGDATDTPVAALHKLQLVSGRPLVRFALPDQFAPARFEDVAITPAGTVLVLDALGQRIFAFQPATRTFVLVSTLADAGVTSIAAADERIIYVAHASGITRLDATTGAATALQAAADVQLAGFGRIRWSQGTLVGLQRAADGIHVVAMRVNGGRAVTAELVAGDVPISDPTAVTLDGNELYVLARAAAGDTSEREIVVQKIRLR